VLREGGGSTHAPTSTPGGKDPPPFPLRMEWRGGFEPVRKGEEGGCCRGANQGPTTTREKAPPPTPGGGAEGVEPVRKGERWWFAHAAPEPPPLARSVLWHVTAQSIPFGASAGREKWRGKEQEKCKTWQPYGPPSVPRGKSAAVNPASMRGEAGNFPRQDNGMVKSQLGDGEGESHLPKRPTVQIQGRPTYHKRQPTSRGQTGEDPV